MVGLVVSWGYNGSVSFRYMRRYWGWFALAFDTFKLNIMVFGELNRMLTVSKFAYNFSTLFEAGCPCPSDP